MTSLGFSFFKILTTLVKKSINAVRVSKDSGSEVSTSKMLYFISRLNLVIYGLATNLLAPFVLAINSV